MDGSLERQAQLIERVLARELKATKAAHRLGITPRHFHRCKARYLEHGLAGLKSRKFGRTAANRTPRSVVEDATALIKTIYADFGPQLASEKLSERHGIELSRETVRRLMIAEGVWIDKASRPIERIHQLREPAERRGQLVQIDGSEHHWFEGRGPKCTLLVFIDDATSELGHLHFAPSESALSYMAATEAYVQKHGRPVAFYSDKHSIFRNAKANPDRRENGTQFGQVLERLEIAIINADTSQAKGRVERANRTLQDRLVKELRLANISDIEAANDFVDGYIQEHNRRFARPPYDETNAHRPLSAEVQLHRAVRWNTERSLTSDLVVHYNKLMFILDDTPAAREARGKRVTVSEHPDGTIEVIFEDEALPYRVRDKIGRITQPEIVDSKRLGAAFRLAEAMQKENPHHKRRNYDAPANSKAAIYANDREQNQRRLNDRAATNFAVRRKVSPQLSFSFSGKRYVLVESAKSRELIGGYVEIHQRDNGEIDAISRGETLPIARYSRPKPREKKSISQSELKALLLGGLSPRDRFQS